MIRLPIFKLDLFLQHYFYVHDYKNFGINHRLNNSLHILKPITMEFVEISLTFSFHRTARTLVRTE